MLKPDNHLKCKCGTRNVLFVVQNSKTKQIVSYCENCIQDYEKTLEKPSADKNE